MEVTKEQSDLINRRKIAEWNRHIIKCAKTAGMEVSGEPTNIDAVLMYALDEKLRHENMSTIECAMKAEMFLEWLKEQHPKN